MNRDLIEEKRIFLYRKEIFTSEKNKNSATFFQNLMLTYVTHVIGFCKTFLCSAKNAIMKENAEVADVNIYIWNEI